MLIRRCKSMKDRQLKWQKEKRTKGQTMMYKTLHRKLKMTTNDITDQINITIYLLHYLIKLRGLYLINHVSAYALATGGGGVWILPSGTNSPPTEVSNR